MATFYARVINQYKYNFQTVFSARFNEQNGDGQLLDEVKKNKLE